MNLFKFFKKKKCVFKIVKYYGKFVNRRNIYKFSSGNENRLIGEKSKYEWKSLRTN